MIFRWNKLFILESPDHSWVFKLSSNSGPTAVYAIGQNKKRSWHLK